MTDLIITKDMPESDRNQKVLIFRSAANPTFCLRNGMFFCQDERHIASLDCDEVPELLPGHSARLVLHFIVDHRPPVPIEWHQSGVYRTACLNGAAAMTHSDVHQICCEIRGEYGQRISTENFATWEKARNWCEAALREAAQ